jgi:hypothetical protein
MADDDQLAFILRSLTQLLKDYGRQRDDMNVMSAMVFRLDDTVAASIDPDASCMVFGSSATGQTEKTSHRAHVFRNTPQ